MKAGNVIQLGGKSYIKSKVVMLPTEKASHLYIQKDKLYFEEYPTKNVNAGNQHLYFLSDEKPKDGEWFMYCDLQGIPLFPLKYDDINQPDDLDKKIVVTTDQSLGGDEPKRYVSAGGHYQESVFWNKWKSEQLPRPSNEFLQAYCKANGKIDEVLIECEIFDLFDGKFDEKIKVSPDNTITIKPVPDHTEQPYGKVGIKEKTFTLQDMQRAWDAAKYSGIKAFTTWFDKAGY